MLLQGLNIGPRYRFDRGPVRPRTGFLNMACSYKAQGAKRKTPSRPRCAKASAGCWKPICGNSKSRARRAGIYEACLSSILVSILLSVYRFSPSIDLSMYQFTYLSLSLCSSWLLSNHLSLPISVSMSAAHLHLHLFVDRYLYLCLSLALSLTLTLILCLSLALSLGLQCGLRGECGLKLSLLHVIAAVLSICRSMSRASSGLVGLGPVYEVAGLWVILPQIIIVILYIETLHSTI